MSAQAEQIIDDLLVRVDQMNIEMLDWLSERDAFFKTSSKLTHSSFVDHKPKVDNAYFETLCSVYLAAEPTQRDRIRARFKGNRGVLTLLNEYYMFLAESVNDATDLPKIRLVLAAASIEDIIPDDWYMEAETFQNMSRSANDSGLLLKPLFDEICSLSDANAAEWLSIPAIRDGSAMDE